MSDQAQDARQSELQIDRLQWGTLRDWSQLVRLPIVFTLFADCLAAGIVVGSRWLPLTAMIPTLAASLCAYWAGMILNDVVDLDEDREFRPNRPLPAGKISPVVAGHVATGMLLVGPILILAANTLHAANQLWLGAAFLSSVALSICVRLYNSVLKRTPLGPILMGGCRSLNILMVGCTLFAVNAEAEMAVLPRPLLALAAAIGVYIIGVTLYASREERDSSSGLLVVGILFEIAGLIGIGYLPRWEAGDQIWTLDPLRGYPLLVALIGVTVVNRSFAGVLHPVSRKVQLAVKHALLTLILIDASVVLMWAGPWYGFAVVLLLVPALTSAIRIRTT